MDKIIDFVNKKVLKKKEPTVDIDKTNFITTIMWGDKSIRMSRNDLRKRSKA